MAEYYLVLVIFETTPGRGNNLSITSNRRMHWSAFVYVHKAKSKHARGASNKDRGEADWHSIIIRVSHVCVQIAAPSIVFDLRLTY